MALVGWPFSLRLFQGPCLLLSCGSVILWLRVVTLQLSPAGGKRHSGEDTPISEIPQLIIFAHLALAFTSYMAVTGGRAGEWEMEFLARQPPSNDSATVCKRNCEF